jgi:hypothetical protein
MSNAIQEEEEHQKLAIRSDSDRILRRQVAEIQAAPAPTTSPLVPAIRRIIVTDSVVPSVGQVNTN